MVVQEEPAAVYRCHNGTSREVTPDGALQTEYGWHVVFDVAISSEAMLPLHVACRKRCSASLIRMLIDAWPEGVATADAKGRVPLHLAAEKAADGKKETKNTTN